MTEFTDAELSVRGAATLVASWEAYACGAPGATVQRAPGVVSAVFPRDPERTVSNNALLQRDLAATARAAAGVERFAAWVHEGDAALRGDLERRGYTLDVSTRAMGMALSDLLLPRPQIALGSLDWSAYLRLFELPPGLLGDADRSAFHLVIARLAGAAVATALAFDHGGDGGISTVTTLAHARRRGLGTAVTALHLHDARARGGQTASLQATPMAERLYAAVGFRDLGRLLEYVPEGQARQRRSAA